ncbi:MAG: hypothetical protein AB7E60_01920 [Sphingobium sp.]
MIAQRPIVDRLGAAGFRTVEGILEWAGLTDPPRALPALFVVPEAEDAQPNRLATGMIDQAVSETFGVIVVVGARARGPGQVDDQLKDVTDRVRDALLGWRHPEASRPAEFAGGRLLSADGYRVAWLVRFRISLHLRKESQ